jgi:metal-responsive CopG/Arc/MetJ family transcriptional regulator
MATKIINISLPEDLVKEIDKAAKAEYASRSDFIRQSVVGRLKNMTNQEDRLWNYLLVTADEASAQAEKMGYTSDQDFARIAKEIRKEIHEKKT